MPNEPKPGDETLIRRVVNDQEIETHRAELAKIKFQNPQPTQFMSQPTNEALLAQVSNIQSQLDSERRKRIERAVNDLVAECRVTAGEADRAIVRAMNDESYLYELRERQQCLPGAAPLNMGAAVHTAGDSVRNALQAIGQKVSRPGEESFWNAAERSNRVSQVYAEARSKILPVMNAAAANTIDAGLKRVLILQETVRDFAIRVLPLRLFSTVFSNVPLQGTDQAVIGYYPLQAAASQDFVDGDGTGGTGYQFGQGTNTNSKTILVNKRKYQPLDYSSNNFRRQPWFDAVRLGKINAEKLGVDILLDILSAFTPANFPTIGQADAAFNPNLNLPAAGYTSDQIDDLKTVATNLNWPDAGRSLITNTTMDNALGKDNNIAAVARIAEDFLNGQYSMIGTDGITTDAGWSLAIADVKAAVTSNAAPTYYQNRALQLFATVAAHRTDAFVDYYHVFKRTITAALPIQVQASMIGKGLVWTTFEMVSFENINGGFFQLDNNSQWLKSPPVVTTAARQKTQVQYSYTEFKQANGLLFKPYNSAVLQYANPTDLPPGA